MAFIVVVGCDLPVNVPPSREPPPLPPPKQPPPSDDPDTYYEQILRKRLDFEEKIFEAMNLYRSTSQKVYQQRAQLKQYLGDKPVSESIELFRKGKLSEIPSDLRVAYSCWQTLLPDETQRLRFAVWIEKQQSIGILEEFDIQIKNFENRREMEEILNEEELAEIDRLLVQIAQQGNELYNPGDKALLEEEAIEIIKTELANWE